MPEGETDLAMVQRHVREGRLSIARQREAVTRLRARGVSTETVEGLLETFERVLAAHHEHLARLKSKRE